MDVVVGPLLQVIMIVLDLYVWVIIIGVVLSWLVAFNVVNTHNRFVHIVGDMVRRLTEPAQAKIRRYLPDLSGLDLSPMILILGIIFARGVAERLYLNLG